MITVSEIAASRIKRSIEKRGKGEGIQVGVKTTGCSGLAYVLEFVDTPDLQSVVYYDSNGVRVFVDQKHLPYIDGMLIDFKRNGLNEGFDFINDNERDRCGCGESFRV